MTTINTGISINSPNVRQIDTSKLTKVDLSDKGKIPNFEPLSLEERQRQMDAQNSANQSTVIEKNGKVIASFGENGFRFFQNNSDYQPSFANKSEDQIIESLQQKYGALTVNKYNQGQGPTAGEIFERIHGYPVPKLVDYTV